MKNSYFNTPRRSEDCTFHSWADPISRDDTPRTDPDTIVMIACAFVAGAVIAMALFGWLS